MHNNNAIIINRNHSSKLIIANITNNNCNHNFVHITTKLYKN